MYLEPRTCATCRWWKPLDKDAEVGICTSVYLNDYASADIVYESGADKGALFQTFDSFGCRDHQADESIDD